MLKEPHVGEANRVRVGMYRAWTGLTVDDACDRDLSQQLQCNVLGYDYTGYGESTGAR